MLLAIDAGNTRTKWALFNELGETGPQYACLNSELGTAHFLPALPGCKHIVISNVAGEQHAALLTKTLSPCQLPTHWIKSSQQTAGVINRYTSPETLGTDRWAALIAAWHLKQCACVVINAGTAITIDVLNVHKNIDALNVSKNNLECLGEFMGGMILPGLDLMQRSLGIATAQLPKTETPAHQATKDIFAKNTANAIYNGALHAALGAIQHMVQALNQHSKQEPQIIISGGNAHIIADALKPYVTNQVSIVDNLVLQGLYLIDSNEK